MATNWLRVSQLVIDLSVLSVSFAAAFFIRFDGAPPLEMTARLALTGPYVVALEIGLLYAYGVRRFVWRYVGLREVLCILQATLVTTFVLLIARFVFGQLQDDYAFLRHGVIPYGVLAANSVLAFMGITGVRVARRMLSERGERTRRQPHRDRPGIPTLLIGAGQGGVLVARELSHRPDLDIEPIGFVDDDPTKSGQVIHGIRVLGTTDQLPELCVRHGARQALITMSSVSGGVIRRMRALCEQAGIEAKIVPGLYEILGDQVNLSRIRPVAIADLLRREPVALDWQAIQKYIAGRTVLVTGAGGSIGSELCRQVSQLSPEHLVLVERTENNLFSIHRELAQATPGLRIIPYIADICDERRISQLFQMHRPAVVLHAAAHKHVPLMELNPGEAIKNNIFGTRVVADIAAASDVDVFVMISTDKAVNPSSVMGACKRVAETYIQALSSQTHTRFVAVRFGNVLDSAGSVVPIFREQIARGGPVTVTHPEMRRYFMTIPEACQLVLQAASMGQGGEIFILDMGAPVKIVDLARDLIVLSGFKPDEDIEIEYCGIRDGEKLFEELATSDEHTDKTAHPKIFVGRIMPTSFDQVQSGLAHLETLLDSPAPQVLRSALRELVPEFGAPPLAVDKPDIEVCKPTTSQHASKPAVASLA